MYIDFLIESFQTHQDSTAIIWKDQEFTYGWLLDRVYHWRKVLDDEGITEGQVIALEADFSPNSVALMVELIGRQAIFVPLTTTVRSKRDEFLAIAQAEVYIKITSDDEATFSFRETKADHELFTVLRERGHPGLILFSSGSTGKSKAAVHDMVDLLDKFRVPRHSFRTISFLLYDHIGGVNTLLYTLANGGCLVTVENRSPDSVLRAVERYNVDLLPTSPTVRNLILLSEAWRRYDLSSLKTVSYGTEPMPESTLKRFHEIFPEIRLLQTYGLSEVGILRSKSRSSDSLWVKIGGEGFETRVVDGILHIKAQSAMLGYLNAPSPFTEDGWFNTQDAVEVEGEYMRILGRKSELINVGGEKVYPAEVEGVIQEVPGVVEASIFGSPNPITGQIVCARITPSEEISTPEARKQLVRDIKKHCRENLQNYKVPVKVDFVEEEQHGERFKKMRRGQTDDQ